MQLKTGSGLSQQRLVYASFVIYSAENAHVLGIGLTFPSDD